MKIYVNNIELNRKLFKIGGLEAAFRKTDVKLFNIIIKKTKSLKNYRKLNKGVNDGN